METLKLDIREALLLGIYNGVACGKKWVKTIFIAI